MNFSQCPDEFQIEQQFNKITHKTINSAINFEDIDPKYKFTYPLQNCGQQIKKTDYEPTPQKYSTSFCEPLNENSRIERRIEKSPFQKPLERSPKQALSYREQGKVQLPNLQIVQQQSPIKSILQFKVDKTFINIRPNKKKIQRQYLPQQQIQRPQIQVAQNNFKFQKANPMSQINQNNLSSLNQSVVIMQNNISEISFHQEPRLNKFNQLLRKAPQQVECEAEKTITWFGNLELCEGRIDGKVVQFIKNQQSNVII